MEKDACARGEVSAAFSRRYRENQLTALVSKEVEQRAKVYPIRWTIAKFSRCIVESRFVPGSQGYRRVILTIFESIYLFIYGGSLKGRQFLFYYYYTDAFNSCIIMIDLGLGKAIDKASNFLDLIYVASSMDVGFWKNMIGASHFITFRKFSSCLYIKVERENSKLSIIR